MAEAGDSTGASALSAPGMILIIMLISGDTRAAAAAAAHINASGGINRRHGAP